MLSQLLSLNTTAQFLRPRRWNSVCGLFLLALAGPLIRAEETDRETVSTMQGASITTIYTRTGRLVETIDGPVELWVDDARFAMRFHRPADAVDLRVLLVSDGNSIFQSQIIRQMKRKGQPVNSGGIAVARLDNGVMPRELGPYWDLPQVIVLALHVCQARRQISQAGALRDEFVPEAILSAILEDGGELRTQVVQDAGSQTHIRFWEVRKGYEGRLYENADCFLFAKLAITSSEKLPVEIDFERFQGKILANGLMTSVISRRYVVRGTTGRGGDRSVFARTSYDPVSRLPVNDYRLGRVTGYVLEKGAPVPFDLSKGTSFGSVQAVYALRAEKISRTTTVRWLIVTGFFLCAVAFGYILVRKRKTNPT